MYIKIYVHLSLKLREFLNINFYRFLVINVFKMLDLTIKGHYLRHVHIVYACTYIQYMPAPISLLPFTKVCSMWDVGMITNVQWSGCVN